MDLDSEFEIEKRRRLYMKAFGEYLDEQKVEAATNKTGNKLLNLTRKENQAVK